MFDEVIRLINFIEEYHKKFSEEYCKIHCTVNLKETRLDTVIYENFYDDFFISLVDNYLDSIKIEDYSMFILNFYSDYEGIETRFRAKNLDSALNKLFYHRFNNEKIEIPIRKILNDLLGFRIILDTTLSYEHIKRELGKLKVFHKKLFRMYIRRDNNENGMENYEGLHIYFKGGNNRFFPWELQIWRKIDEISNEKSHEKHKAKRKYIKWTEIYKDNKHREEE